MEGCIACELADGRRPLPRGLIHRTDHWLVRALIGPLGLGTLIVKPERHLTAVADLSDAEASEPGPLLKLASSVARRLVEADQVYNCLWSCSPVTKTEMEFFNAAGPALQVAMFERTQMLDPGDVERIARNGAAVLPVDVSNAPPTVHRPADAVASWVSRRRLSRRPHDWKPSFKVTPWSLSVIMSPLKVAIGESVSRIGKSVPRRRRIGR